MYLQKRWSILLVLLFVLIVGTVTAVSGQSVAPASTDDLSATTDDLVFIHHSVGQFWLNNSLDAALLAKSYIDERNDITYGTVVPPDSGRPATLGSNPGSLTDMKHWLFWFNDYLEGVKQHDSSSGYNRIIMFKTCYTGNYVSPDSEPIDPFSNTRTIANYQAVFRHPDGPGNTYSYNGYTYLPLEDIFAANPDVLFIPLTYPPACITCVNDTQSQRSRVFNDWLVNEWLPSYQAAHPGLNNVAVFHYFDFLAYPDNHAQYPNRLKIEYGGDTGDSHPNDTANSAATAVFATNPDNFIDNAWNAYLGTTPVTWNFAKTASAPNGTISKPITYTITIANEDIPIATSVWLTDVIPAGLAYVPGSLTASSGQVDESEAPTLYWQGEVTPNTAVTITYTVHINTVVTQIITNQAVITVDGMDPVTRSASLLVNGRLILLPLLRDSGN